jgi:hypothetical protein
VTRSLAENNVDSESLSSIPRVATIPAVRGRRVWGQTLNRFPTAKGTFFHIAVARSLSGSSRISVMQCRRSPAHPMQLCEPLVPGPSLHCHLGDIKFGRNAQNLRQTSQVQRAFKCASTVRGGLFHIPKRLREPLVFGPSLRD